MVLKKLLIAFVFTYSTGLFAADANLLIKKMQLAIDKNQLEQVEDIYEDNESTLSNQWLAQERLAISYERRNKMKEAIEIYKKLISVFNKNTHDKVMSLAKDQTLSDSEANATKLPFYYYKMAFLNAMMFKSSNRYMPFEERKKFLANTQGYLQLCKRVKVAPEDLTLIEDMVKEKIKFENDQTFRTSWYSLLNVISWQDRVVLINNASNARYNLLSTVIGTSVGLGKKWENARYELNLESTLALGSSTISAEDATITYDQSSVPVTNILLGPGFYYKGFSDKVFVGMYFPLSYRMGDWELPAGNYSFEDKTKFGGGYLIQLKYNVGKVSLHTRLGKIFPNPGSHWSIGGIYDF